MKITVCGSIAFYTEMETLRDGLLALGHEVKIPELNAEAPEELGGDKKVYFGKYIEEHGGVDAFPPGHEIWHHKASAIRDHFEKLDWCDAVLVANYEKRGTKGYVGANTLIEAGVAFYLHKPIYLLYPIGKELSSVVELMAMEPRILNGDLALL